MKKIIELDIDKVLDYYNYQLKTYYKLNGSVLTVEYDLNDYLQKYIKELIAEKEGFECKFEIIHFTENGLLEIEYETSL